MQEQTVGWALHALEPDEEIDVVEHLPGCAACRRTAEDVSGVTAALATALPQVDPPPRLRASIVAAAEATPQIERERPATGNRPASIEPVAGRHREQADPPADTGATVSWFRRPGRMLLAAAAAVVVLAGAGAVSGRIQGLQAERDASVAQSQQLDRALSAIGNPEAQHAFLAPEPNAPAVAAVVVQDGRREVVPIELAPNRTDDQTYVLWGLAGDGTPKAVGTFDVRAGESGPLAVKSPESGTFGTYAVSLERGREAPAAPSAVVAAGKVGT